MVKPSLPALSSRTAGRSVDVQLVAVDRKKRVRRTMIERPTRTRTVSHLRPGQRKVKADAKKDPKKE